MYEGRDGSGSDGQEPVGEVDDVGEDGLDPQACGQCHVCGSLFPFGLPLCDRGLLGLVGLTVGVGVGGGVGKSPLTELLMAKIGLCLALLTVSNTKVTVHAVIVVRVGQAPIEGILTPKKIIN